MTCNCNGLADAQTLFGRNHATALPMDGSYRGVTRCKHGQAFRVLEVGPSNYPTRQIAETQVEEELALFRTDT